MNTAVKYGFFIVSTAIILKLVLIFTKTEQRFAAEEVPALIFIFAGGLWLSLRATQDKEYNKAANPMQLLKAGLTTSAISSLVFTLFLIGIKISQHDLPPSVSDLIMAILSLFIFILLLGGLLSVFVAYMVSRKKS